MNPKPHSHSSTTPHDSNTSSSLPISQSDLASQLLLTSSKYIETLGLLTNDDVIDNFKLQRELEDKLIENLRNNNSNNKTIFQLYDIVPTLKEGINNIISDDFSKCFLSQEPFHWNWNLYLFPLWCAGVIIRYFILFPLRLLFLIISLLLLFTLFGIVFLFNEPYRSKMQRWIIRTCCSVFVMSWTGVIRYHGVIPSRKRNQIYVANHTSMIDLIILEQNNTFAAVGQQHKGWLAFIQNKVLACLGCIWFDRASLTDKNVTAKRLREHMQNPNANRLILFPEGTCVNNEYCVQFKKGAFELGAEVCPIAIKYNKIFVDAFWNSRAQSFLMHLLTLMKSWAVVCDVYYLEPQTQLPGESSIDFAARVKALISDKAGLKNVEFDGYLKHFKPSQRYVEEKQKLFAEKLSKKYPILKLDSKDSSNKKDK